MAAAALAQALNPGLLQYWIIIPLEVMLTLCQCIRSNENMHIFKCSKTTDYFVENFAGGGPEFEAMPLVTAYYCSKLM